MTGAEQILLCHGTMMEACSDQEEAAGVPIHLQRLQLADQGYEGLRRLRVQHSIRIHPELRLADGLDAAQVHLRGHPNSADAARTSALSTHS